MNFYTSLIESGHLASFLGGSLSAAFLICGIVKLREWWHSRKSRRPRKQLHLPPRLHLEEARSRLHRATVKLTELASKPIFPKPRLDKVAYPKWPPDGEFTGKSPTILTSRNPDGNARVTESTITKE